MTERFDFDPTVPCGYRERADGDFVSYHRYRDLAARLVEAERRIDRAILIARAGLTAAPHQLTGRNLVGDFDAIVRALCASDSAEPRETDGL